MNQKFIVTNEETYCILQIKFEKFLENIENIMCLYDDTSYKYNVINNEWNNLDNIYGELDGYYFQLIKSNFIENEKIYIKVKEVTEKYIKEIIKSVSIINSNIEDKTKVSAKEVLDILNEIYESR